jgi:hypothetical protein
MTVLIYVDTSKQVGDTRPIEINCSSQTWMDRCSSVCRCSGPAHAPRRPSPERRNSARGHVAVYSDAPSRHWWKHKT